jgi:addiction module HigA family antidote
VTKTRRVFAVHPGEILKTEFMEPMGVSAYALAKALNFPGIYEVVRGDRAISADTAIRLGKYFGLPAQFWLNLQNDYDLRLAEGSGVGERIKPRHVDTRPKSTRHGSRRDFPTGNQSNPRSFHFLSTSALVFSSMRISSGQGRVNPSLDHLRVASMPIFDP